MPLQDCINIFCHVFSFNFVDFYAHSMIGMVSKKLIYQLVWLVGLLSSAVATSIMSGQVTNMVAIWQKFSA
jgi:hypothetical protein